MAPVIITVRGRGYSISADSSETAGGGPDDDDDPNDPNPSKAPRQPLGGVPRSL